MRQDGELTLDEAIKPFIDYTNLPGFDKLSDDYILTVGSSIAARQLTAGHIRDLVEAYRYEKANSV